MLEPREIVQETSGSRTLLLKRMGILADGFALPGGFHDPRTERALKETGFRYCLTSFPGRVDVGSSLFRLPRIDSEYPLPILRQHMLSAILEKA